MPSVPCRWKVKKGMEDEWEVGGRMSMGFLWAPHGALFELGALWSYENRRILRTNKKPNEHLMKILRKSSGRRGFSENLTSILRITNENQNEYHAKILRKSAAATNQKKSQRKSREDLRKSSGRRGPYEPRTLRRSCENLANTAAMRNRAAPMQSPCANALH